MIFRKNPTRASSKIVFLALLFGFLQINFFLATSSFANSFSQSNVRELKEFDCVDDDNTILPVDNQRVLNFKNSTKPSFMTRAHVEGRVVVLYADRTGHSHFSIQIGEMRSETIEVVYNEEFGALPEQLNLGSLVHACGDYITLKKGKGRGTSPDGAIIHWVHGLDPARPTTHKPGFVKVENVLYGNALMDAQ